MWMQNISRTNEVIGNKIYGGMSGTGMDLEYISVNSGSASIIANNAISMGSTASANQTTGIYAMWYNPGYFYNNSVVVFGTNTSNTAMYANTFFNSSSSDYIENNIFANLGDSSHSYGTALALVNGAWFSYDYNDYYVLSGGNITSDNGTGYTSLSSWKSTESPNDANSKAESPGFTNSSDLHISDLCLRGLSGLVTTDITGATRSNPPSMGAYEGSGGISNDLGISAITAPLVPFAPGVHTITVTVKNYGTNSITSGSINYSVNGGPAITQAFTATLAACATTNISFSTTYNFASGGSFNLKTWTSSPNGGSDNNASNDTLVSDFCPALNGVYSIDPAGSGSTNFTSFTNAVNVLTCGGVSGPVVFNVSPGTYNEQIDITTVAGTSSTNTVTFEGVSTDSTQVTLSYASSLSNANYTVAINGASYITFKEMTIAATGSNYGYALSFGSNSNHDSIASCQLTGVSTFSSSSDYSVVYSVSNHNDYLVINNSLISNGSYGLYLQGNGSSSSSTTQSYNVIQGNIFLNQYYTGLYLFYQTASIVNSNIIATTSSNTNWYGIYTYGAMNGCKFTSNKISGSAGGYGFYLYFNNFDQNYTNNTPNVVANNFISGGTGSNSFYGIYTFYNLACHIYYNSVNVSSSNGYAMYLDGYWSSPSVNVEDNIFAATSSSSGALAYYLYDIGYVNTEDYNDYYIAAGTSLLSLGGTTYTSVSSWNTATSYDANSVNVAPGYFSASNLHTSVGGLYQKGIHITGISTDIDGNSRPTNPCIGASEYTPVPNDAGISAFSPTAGFCSGSTQSVWVTLNNYGTSALTSAQITFRVNGVAAIIYNWTGNITPGDTASQVNIGSLSYPTGAATIAARTDLPNGATDGNTANDSVSVSVAPALNGSYTIGTSGDFASFTDAAAALGYGICGPVVFNVADGMYNEQVSVPAITGASATNTVIFQSASQDSTAVILYYAASFNDYVMQLNGASFVTVKQITMQQEGGIYGYGGVLSLQNSAHDNRIINNRLIGSNIYNNLTYDAVVADNTYNVDSNNWFMHNQITGDFNSFDIEGEWFSGPSYYISGLVISNNIVDSFYNNGIEVLGVHSPVITDNQIYDSSYSGTWGIYGQFLDNGGQILRNKIYAANDGVGIAIFDWNGTSSANRGVIANNFASVTGPGSGGNGLYIQDLVDIQIVYNNFLDNEPTDNAILIDESTTNSDLVLENNNAFNSGGGAAVNYTHANYPDTADYNNYYTTGSVFGNYLGTGYSTLVDFRTASGMDSHTISTNPFYTSLTDLHSNSCGIKNRGINIPNITTDIDGKPRTLLPDIGANEVSSISGQWTGTTSADWFTAANWCNDTVPSCANSTNVHIPYINITGVGTFNYPTYNGNGSCHDLIVDSAAQITVTGGMLGICGNVTNNGTFTASSGVISLDGGTQNVAGINFYDLKLNASGTKTLTGNAYVKDSLVCNTGYLATDSFTVTLDSGAWLKENLTGSSQIWGAVTTQKYIPGDNTRYHFAGIGCDIQSPVTAGIITVTRNTGSSAVCTSLTTGNSGIERNFVITPTVNQGHLNAHLWLYYSDIELVNNVDTTNMMMFRNGGSQWNYVPSTSQDPVVVNTVSHNINRNAIDSFSTWTIGSSLTPLPVELTSFNAVLQDPQTARLNWVTSSERNNDYFIIERSADNGKTFEKIGTVKGNGTTMQEHSYQYFDNNINLLMACNLYYRLMQQDVNGKINDPGTGIREIVLCQPAAPANSDKVWYNQNEDRIYINYSTTNNSENLQVALTDMQGNIVVSQNVKALNGINQMTVNMYGLAKGIYNLTIISNESTKTVKVLKD